MKGIGLFPILLIMLVAAGGGLALSALVSPVPNSATALPNASTGDPGDLVEIGTEAAQNIPLSGIVDYLTSGVWAFVDFFTNYLILPVGGWASAAAGTPIAIPTFAGLAITVVLLAWLFFRKWSSIWDLVIKLVMFVIIIGVLIFLLGIIFKMMGVI